MSKGGGAGKVYFVLYLAVVLELLIIIVERDEAEEHLNKKNKEAMRIVESILSQLQSGAGTEGINTRPQDEITIPPPGIDIKAVMGGDIKSFRQYIVDVGVTDVGAALVKREFETEKEYVQRVRKLVELANVEQIQYQVFYNSDPNPDNAPAFPTDDFLKDKNIDLLTMEPGARISDESTDISWEYLGMQELNMDEDGTFNKINLSDISTSQLSPIYSDAIRKRIGPSFNPNGVPEDSTFYYSDDETMKNITKGSEIQKRSFVVNFQPPSQAGWYKLRFVSRTNRILGVKSGQSAEEMGDEATVNIGTVQLKVADLRKVMKELNSRLEKYTLPTLEELTTSQDVTAFDKALAESRVQAQGESKAEEIQGNITLYGYIVKLLAPGMSSNFDQNKGSIEFNIRVVTPKPNVAEPVVTIPEYVPTFDAVAAVFECQISPYQPNQNVMEGYVMDAGGNRVASIRFTPLDEIAGLGYTKPIANESRFYRAVIDKELSPGKYEYTVIHKLAQRQSKPATRVLEVFATALTEQSERALNQRLSAFAYYGNPVNFSVEPSSGGKIKSNEFRIHITTDKNNQIPPINGLSVSTQDGLKFTPDYKQMGIRVSWVQPYTEKEVDILPTKTIDIKLEEPAILTNTMKVNVSGTAAQLTVRIDNINISKPLTGDDSKPNASVALSIRGESSIKDGLNGFSLTSEPVIEQDGDYYSITFMMTGKLERGQTKVTGEVAINLQAVATNPVNGVKSSRLQAVPVNIDYEPSSGAGNRRRR